MNEIQQFIINPQIEYFNEPGEPEAVDHVLSNFGGKISPDLRLTFTEESFRVLMQKVKELTGWDLTLKPGEPYPIQLLDSPCSVCKRLEPMKQNNGLDHEAIRGARARK